MLQMSRMPCLVQALAYGKFFHFQNDWKMKNTLKENVLFLNDGDKLLDFHLDPL